MNQNTASAKYALALLLLAATPKLMAQAAVQPQPKPEATEEDTVVLSPFTVSASDDTSGYAVKDTLAGTRVRTELRDVASALSVVNAQFLQDTGAKDNTSLLVYTTNTEVGGITGNFSGAGGGQTYTEVGKLLRPQNNTRVRGLDAADNTRDYFLTEIPWDGYNVDRVDMQRGPNSILFGVGSPAGIINTSLNGAAFKDSGKYENRISQYGSMRNSFDYNKVIIKGQLGIRFAAVDDNEKYKQEPAYQHGQRIYGALRYDPKLFGPEAKTSIRANYERGNIEANRPRSLPPVDGITPWFLTGKDPYGNNYANKAVINPLTDWTALTANPAYPNKVAPWYAYAGMGRGGNNSMSMKFDASSARPISVQATVVGDDGGLNASGVKDGTIVGVPFSSYASVAAFNAYANQSGMPGAAYYGNKSLSDTSIFDFTNHLIDGENKSEYQKWEASNLAVSQTFFSDRFGVEYVYDYQRYEEGQVSFLSGGEYVMSIDVNSHLVDGSTNPNVGRPFVGNSGQYGNSENYVDRDSQRFTAFGDLRFEDLLGKTKLAKLLGHHVFTGLVSQDIKRSDSRGYSRWATTPAFADATYQKYDLNTGPAQVDWIAYLGPSLLNATSASGANLSRVTAKIAPQQYESLRYFDSTWKATGVAFDAPYTYTSYTNTDTTTGPIGGPVQVTDVQAENPANYVGWTSKNFETLSADRGDIESLYTDGQKSRNKIQSQGLTWQGYMLSDVFVPVFGWRKDKVTNSSSQAPKNGANVSSMDYGVDTSEANTREVTGESTSYGAVLHTPKSWAAKLPGNTSISIFANSSENFKADAPRGDIFGTQLANPTGETKDYGFVLTTLNDKLTLKVTRYETKIKDATLSGDSAGFGNSLYYVWALPYWGATHALAALDGVADPQRRQGNWGWPWNGIATMPNPSNPNETVPDNARIKAIARDFFVNFPLDQHFADEYGLSMIVDKMHVDSEASWYASVPAYGSGSIADGGKGASELGLQPAYSGKLKSFGTGPVATGDTTSKGYEVEVTAQLTKNWNVTANASQTEAKRTSISPTIDGWINTMTDFVAGDAGLIKIWGGDTLRKNWNDQIMSRYNVLKAQLGQQAPEIPEWRFNFITNYNFDHGLLKGVNTGLAYRWEDKRVLGYEYDPATDALDVNKPYRGADSQHFDLWVGYGRKLTSKIDWRIQLNVRNVGESTDLVPVSINPDGAVALSRIQEGMGWTVTNTFTF